MILDYAGETGKVYTHAQVAVPDLDGPVLAAGGDELAVAAVGAAGGGDPLTLLGARLEHGLVLLLRVQVPGAHRAGGRGTGQNSACESLTSQ